MIWLIIGILAVILVVPCVVLSNFYANKVASELCKHCIYQGWEGKESPCYRCIDCDHFERKVEDGT